MYQYETRLLKQGHKRILGIDEVGRGCLAGPLVVAGVVLNPNHKIDGLDDSKKLTEKKREALYTEIKAHALEIEIVFIDAVTIDRINILESTKQAMRTVFDTVKPDYGLIDAVNINRTPTESIIKGDANSASIAAASIIAKVTRDRFMKELAKEYPAYAFESHKGYGTKKHLEALKANGPIEGIHRMSFHPVQVLRQMSLDI